MFFTFRFETGKQEVFFKIGAESENTYCKNSGTPCQKPQHKVEEAPFSPLLNM